MSMYKYFCVLLLLICPTLSTAQNYNVIVRLKGDVRIMHRGDQQWETLKLHDTVKLVDKINLSSNSSVSIMRTSTRAVYTANSTAQLTVHDIIKKAESRDMAVINNILKENASSGKENTQRDYTSYGASVRGQNGRSEIDAVYACVCRALKDIYAYSEIKEHDDSPAISRIYADNTYSFKATDVADCDYFVNIFCVNLHSHSVEACYPYNISIAKAKSEFVLPGEFYDSEDVIYLLVASSVDYDASLISLKFKNSEQPQNCIENVKVACSISTEARRLLQQCSSKNQR